MLIVATCLWDANERSEHFSRCYGEDWVDKLYRGFRRNLTVPFRFVVFTDRRRVFAEPVEQEMLAAATPDYGCLIEPFRLDAPMILAGLDTVITRNIDDMAEYCLAGARIALPRDPYQPDRAINAVALVPGGNRAVFDHWRGENDMAWLRRHETNFIDDLFPGQVLSLKFHDLRRKGIGDARIVYFHGEPKPPSLGHLPWIRAHWI